MMRVFMLVALSLALGVVPAAAQDGIGRRWLGEDKWKHFFASFFVTSVSGSAGRAAGLSPEQSLAASLAVGVSVGIAKEIVDLHRGARFDESLRDLAWDAAGITVGAVLLRRSFVPDAAAK
jgi:uncharacterized protein YfiM (DUF2279 family)